MKIYVLEKEFFRLQDQTYSKITEIVDADLDLERLIKASEPIRVQNKMFIDNNYLTESIVKHFASPGGNITLRIKQFTKEEIVESND